MQDRAHQEGRAQGDLAAEAGFEEAHQRPADERADGQAAPPEEAVDAVDAAQQVVGDDRLPERDRDDVPEHHREAVHGGDGPDDPGA